MSSIAPPVRVPNPLVRAADADELAAWQRRATPSLARVTDDIWVMPIPAPGLPIYYTLCYVIRTDDSLVLIDPGLNSDQSWAALQDGLTQIGFTIDQLRGVVSTHTHPDHVGMAARLSRASGAWLAIGAGERLPPTGSTIEGLTDADAALLDVWGVPDAAREDLNFWRAGRISGQEIPPVDFFLEHDQRVPGTQLFTISTVGHTPGHICLRTDDGSIVFTGDHVLPQITPHVSAASDLPFDPLALYRASLDRLAPFSEALACPGHEYRFHGLGARLDQLHAAISERNDEVRRVLADTGPRTIWDLARQLTWSRTWESLTGINHRLALAETASHVEHLTKPYPTTDLPPTRLVHYDSPSATG